MLKLFFINIVNREDSTRAISLIRICLIFLLWKRFSGYFLLFGNIPFDQLIIGLFFYASSILVLLGFLSRISLPLLAFTMISIYYYLGHYLKIHSITSHHTYLLCIVPTFLALSPCEKSFSLDRYFTFRKAIANRQKLPQERGVIWPSILIGLQLSSIYFWSAYSKISPDFISGERLEMIFAYTYYDYEITKFSSFSLIAKILSISTILVELLLAFGLWFKSSRNLTLAIGVFFHLTLYYTLPVSTFSLTMILLYLVFIPPKQVHQVIDTLMGINSNTSIKT